MAEVSIWHRLLRSWTELFMAGRVSREDWLAMNATIASEYPPESKEGPPLTLLAKLHAAVERAIEQPRLIPEEEPSA